MKNLRTVLLYPILLAAPLHSQTYTVGDTVENFVFTDYSSGENVSLYDLGADGGVLVLEWFAWWCPFCANAAANVETGIIEHYGAMGDTNPNSVPVRHIALNVQGDARSQSDTFIDRYGIHTVMEDYDREFFNLFSPGGGQPLFVIINAEPDSPTAARWEVLYTRLNYAGNAAPDISGLMRPVIDTIQPGSTGDPLKALFPNIEDPVDNWYQSEWFGWFYNQDYPLINHLELGFGYLAPAPGSNTVYFHNSAWQWLFTGETFYPFFFCHLTNDWLFYLEGSMGEWFYEYASMEWRNSPPGS